MTMSVKVTNTSSDHTGYVENANGVRTEIAPGESAEVNVWIGGSATISEGSAIAVEPEPAKG